MMGELALRFAPLGLELAVIQCWSEWNDICDRLSRNELAVIHCWSEWNEICDKLSRNDANVCSDSRLAQANATSDS